MADSKERKDNIEGIQNSEDLLNLSNNILNSYDERVKSLGKLNAEERLYRATVSQQQKLSQQIAANADKYLGYQIKSKDLAKDIKSTQDNLNKSTEAFLKIRNDIAKQYGDAIKSSKETIQKIETENKLNQKQTNIIDLNRAAINRLTEKKEKGLRIDNEALEKAKKDLETAQEEVKVSDKLLKNLEIERQKQDNIAKSSENIIANGIESKEAQIKELTFLNKNLQTRKQIEKSTGLLGAFSKSISKIPGIGQYLNADEAIEEMEKLAASIEESGESATSFGNRLKIAGKGLSVLAKGFYENIKSPEAIITFFVNAAITANKESVNLSKNLGYGAANADRVRANFVDIESSSNNLNVTTANLSGAFNELSESTGFVSEYSADALTTQIKLTKQLGLTGDEASGIYKFSVLTGKSSEATYQSMLKGYVATRNSLGVGVPFKAAMAEAAKVSGQLASNLGNNPETIIKAVVATRALGTSLEQAKSQGESLLDFQSSIENELKAELITGQQLNLERARSAALMGDQVTVAEELAAQGMTAAKFSGMNVLAQKSFAQALGTTSDELANQLAKREMAIASGKSLAQITAEEADEAAERQDIQEKFNAAMLKLQSIVGNLLAGPLGSFLEMLSGALDIINYMAVPLKMVGLLFLGIRGTQMAINAAKLIGLGIDRANYAVKATQMGAEAFITREKGVQGLMDKQGLLSRIGYNAQLLFSLIREQGISGIKTFIRTLDFTSLVTARTKAVLDTSSLIASRSQAAILPGMIALKGVEAAVTTEIAGASVVAASAATLGIGAVSIIAGIAAIMGAAATYMFMKDGVVDPNKGPVMSGDFGSVQMDPNDKAMYGADGKIKVGTNLLGEKNIESVKSTSNIDLSPMIAAINQVTSAVNALNAKSWDVYLDSKAVGTGLMQKSYKSA